MGLRDLAKQVLVEQQNRRYEKLLAQKQCTYAQWTQRRTLFGEGESKIASEEYQVFITGKGRLSGDAAIKIDCYFKDNPQILIAYGDEDVWGSGEQDPSNPWFKPDWSPDTFKHHFYFGGAVVIRKSLMDKVERDEWDLRTWIRQCVELAGGYEKNCQTIGHISEVLFHHETLEGMLENTRAYGEPEVDENSEELPQDEADAVAAKLSIIIPSKDQPDVLGSCLRSVVGACEQMDYEVIVVDNGSNEENKAVIMALVEELSTEERPIYYLYHPMEFHFSLMCNLGARAAKGEVLLFLNDDVELCSESGMDVMLANARQLYVGAVGMKLYYPQSKRIQHVGIVNLPMGPVHKLQFMEDDKEYYFDSNRCPKNAIAVTAACLMIEKEKFLEAGGFPSDLRVAFNDVSLCFRLVELGYQNVCRNDLYAYHHESLSRGDDESEEKLQRLLQERAVLYQKHPALDGCDPYYSVHFSREGLDTGIRPAFETSGNKVQELKQDLITVLPNAELSGYREDACVLLRVESFIDNKLQGYSVVLGDNNACYDMVLLLQGVTGMVYQTPLEGQYRPDLVENMPDQVNVGLCGFHVSFASTFENHGMGGDVSFAGKMPQQGLPRGHYRVGVLARNRVGSSVLYHWSNRYIDI